MKVYCMCKTSSDYLPEKTVSEAKKDFLLDKKTGEICDCVRAKSVRLVSHVTGNIHFVRCKTYKCESCGIAKKIKIQQKLNEFLESCDFIRMWTFTISSNFGSIAENSALWSKAWRRFVTELRRDFALSEKQRKTSYFRVAELHKSGYIHYHVCVNQYLPVQIIRTLWQKCVAHALGYYPKTAFANVNIKQINNAATAAKYVSKYLEKGIAQAEYSDILRTSKSRDIPPFFPKKISVCEFVVLNEKDAFAYSMYVRMKSELASAKLEQIKNVATKKTENVAYMPYELNEFYSFDDPTIDFSRFLE